MTHFGTPFCMLLHSSHSSLCSLTSGLAFQGLQKKTDPIPVTFADAGFSFEDGFPCAALAMESIGLAKETSLSSGSVRSSRYIRWGATTVVEAFRGGNTQEEAQKGTLTKYQVQVLSGFIQHDLLTIDRNRVGVSGVCDSDLVPDGTGFPGIRSMFPLFWPRDFGKKGAFQLMFGF